jgi:Methyltransferase domain
MIENRINEEARKLMLPPPVESFPQFFDEASYRTGYGPVPYERSRYWMSKMSGIAENLIRALRPTKVLDAGCALGLLVEAFHDQGVEAWGVDVSEFAIANVRRDMRLYCRGASLVRPLGESYDLITCIEVMQYLPDDQVLDAIRNITVATDTIVFAANPFDMDTSSFSQVRPTLAWLELFAEHGFSPDITFDAGFISPHALLLKRQPPLSRNVIQLLSECIRWRHQASRGTAAVEPTENLPDDPEIPLPGVHGQLREAEAEIDRLRISLADAEKRTRGLELAEAQLAQQKERVVQLEAQLNREREHLNGLRSVQALLIQEAARMRDAIRVPGHLVNSVDLEESESRLKKEFSFGAGEAQRIQVALQQLSSEQVRMAGEIQASANHVNSQLTQFGFSLNHVAGRVESILQSRIWKVLAGAGGLVLRLTPGKRP